MQGEPAGTCVPSLPRRPPWFNFLHSREVKNNKLEQPPRELAHPRLGNPGSATEKSKTNLDLVFRIFVDPVVNYVHLESLHLSLIFRMVTRLMSR